MDGWMGEWMDGPMAFILPSPGFSLHSTSSRPVVVALALALTLAG